MGLADIVKKVADVFTDSPAPKAISNAAQHGAKAIGGIGGDAFGVASDAMQAGGDLFGGAMRNTGGDMFGATMRGAGQVGSLFGRATSGMSGDPFGGIMGGSNDPRGVFGSSMLSGNTNPWSMSDPFFNTKMETERQKRDEENMKWLEEEQAKADAAAGGGGVSGGSGIQGDVSKAQVDRIKGTDQWNSMIQRAASEAGIPASIIKGLMAIESGGVNPGGANYAGAKGLMQILPEYWQGMADQFGGDLSDPWVSIRTGAEIMKTLKNEHGTWERAANAYFTGSPDKVASDAYTDSPTYVRMFQNNVAWIEAQQNQGSGGALPPLPGGGVGVGAVNAAMTAVGTPYVWGGESYEEGGFDCSGLIQWAYAQAGKQIPRDTSQVMDQKYRNGNLNMGNLQPGDLVFYQFPGGQPGTDHVAMYAGNGKLVQATSAYGNTTTTPVNWSAEYITGYGRIP